MNKKFLIKIFSFGIIILFICAEITSAFNIEQSEISIKHSSWLYVGGSGEGNYSKIQYAIDNATDGDTVFVFNDSSPYYENIIIVKSITLIGEDRNSVIIDAGGSGKVVSCNASNVKISGFTIQNSGNETWEDAGIFIDNTDNNTVTGNIITNTECGIYCYTSYYPSSDYHIIFKNKISNNKIGIFLDFSFKNEIYENYIEDNNRWGILVGSSTHPSKSTDDLENEVYNNIYRNTFTKNDKAIYLDIAIYNNIFENNITNNNYGIHLVPPYLSSCNCNKIYQNNINNNTYGILAEADGGFIIANTISKNNIMFNEEGITFILYDNDYGFYYKISRNKISYNNFIGNTNTVNFKYSLFNLWIGNYWGKGRLFPYPIFGELKIRDDVYRWISFDWHPALEPYEN